jgi:nitrite reductase/ring-hydroxylating ferredoxin subunit
MIDPTPEAGRQANWIRAIDIAALRERGRAVVKLDGRQVALFAHGTRIYACNNRCPHEGYPLVEGDVRTDAGECLLTCQWHNWQFDLGSGANRYGGDRLRVYPTREADGTVWVDAADAPAAERIASARTALREAFDEHEYDRIARELARLAKAGADPVDSVGDAIGWSASRLEDGFTHAYAAAAQWLRWHDAHAADPEQQLTAALEAIGHIAWDVLRQPAFPYPQEVDRFEAGALSAAIDAQDEAAAVAQVRGALQAGLGFAAVEAPLTRAALAHYTGFGHGLIYVTHCASLVGRLGAGVSEPLLLALVRYLTRATREDLVPDFRAYAPALAGWPAARGDGVAPAPESLAGLPLKEVLRATLAAAASVPPLPLYHALLGASALMLARFDTRHERATSDNPSLAIGWLDFTHAITFAHAVRRQCTRFPALWPAGLLQMALFVGRNAAFIDPAIVLPPPPSDEDLETLAHDAVSDHGLGHYVFSAHRLKTWMAARDELVSAPAPVAQALRVALARYLAAPMRERHVRRTVRQARKFVALED